MSIDTSVLERYSAGAREREAALCCPVSYDRELLALLPSEIVEKDYGCGDPSRYVRPGDTVLDLGSGSGKICYMATQLVGVEGQVIGVDINDDMLALARKYQPEMAAKLGGDRVRFVKGYIQDLALDVASLERHLAEYPVRDARALAELQLWQDRQRAERPLIADGSVDLVISNCVLNLVRDEDKNRLVREIHRVLKPGGRVAISDIVSDQAVPAHLKANPELWSGCIAGAFQEQEFLQVFVEAGFLAIRLDKWDSHPWQIVDGIEFRSVTVTAVKGDGKDCIEHGHQVIYRGPFAEVRDEEGHVFPRGERVAVCERTFRFITQGPLKEDFIAIAPAGVAEPESAAPETRGPAEAMTRGAVRESSCGSRGCC